MVPSTRPSADYGDREVARHSDNGMGNACRWMRNRVDLTVKGRFSEATNDGVDRILRDLRDPSGRALWNSESQRVRRIQ